MSNEKDICRTLYNSIIKGCAIDVSGILKEGGEEGSRGRNAKGVIEVNFYCDTYGYGYLNQFDDLRKIYKKEYIEEYGCDEDDEDDKDTIDYIMEEFDLYDYIARLCITDVVSTLILDDIEYHRVKRIVDGYDIIVLNLDNIMKSMDIIVYTNINPDVSEQKYLIYFCGVNLSNQSCPPTAETLYNIIVQTNINIIPRRFRKRFISIKDFIFSLMDFSKEMRRIYNKYDYQMW